MEYRKKYYSNMSANQGQIKRVSKVLTLCETINKKDLMFQEFVDYVTPLLDDKLKT